MSTAYELAREAYAAEGIDTEAVLAKLAGKATTSWVSTRKTTRPPAAS